MTTPSTAQMAWVPAEPGPTYRGLLTALVTADVDAVDEDSRHLLENGPGVTGGGDLLELGRGDRGSGGDLALVEQGALGGDRDGLLDGRLQGDLDRGVATDGDADVRVLDARETLELGAQVVGARRQAEETELPLGIGDLHLRGASARQSHGDPWEGGALVVDDGTVEVAALQLGEGGTADDQKQQRGHYYGAPPKFAALHKDEPPSVRWLEEPSASEGPE